MTQFLAEITQLSALSLPPENNLSEYLTLVQPGACAIAGRYAAAD
jgi:hypothetical protein